MVTFLAVIHIVACLGLIGLVMIQDSKGGGVFASQSSSSSVLGSGGATSLAQTLTKIMAVVFAATCISLSIIATRGEKSVIDAGVVSSLPAATTTAPVETAPAATTTAPAATTQPAAPAEPKK